jgi:hypothetical protein
VIEITTEMEQKDHQQANDKAAAHYALAVPSTFLIRILSSLLRAIGQSKIVLVDKINPSQDWRAQAFLQVTFDRFEVAATLHRDVLVRS